MKTTTKQNDFILVMNDGYKYFLINGKGYKTNHLNPENHIEEIFNHSNFREIYKNNHKKYIEF